MTLDPHPTPAALRAMAVKKGVRVEEGPAAGRKQGASRSKGPKAPSVRPWGMFRSKWEAEYAYRLNIQKAAGLVLGWEYEPRSFTIGVGAKYTPDFMVVMSADGLPEWHEVKGYRREAAIVRLKAAALAHPDERFILVTKKRGQWVQTPVRAELRSALD